MTAEAIKKLEVLSRDAIDKKIRKLEWIIEHRLGTRYTVAALMKAKRERALIK